MTPLESYWNNVLFQSGKIILPIMFFPLVVAYYHRQYWNKPLNIAFIFCLLTFIFNLLEHLLVAAFRNYPDFFSTFLESWKINNSFFIQILFYWTNFLLLSLFFSKIISLEKVQETIFKLGWILSLIVTINFFLIEGFTSQGYFNPSINAIFVILVPMFYLWVSQKNSLRIKLTKNPYLWFSLGLILPNLVSLFLYFSGSFIYGTNFILFAKLHTVKNVFLILGQILIAIGFAHSYYARFIKINE